ncbi:MAG TPA: class I SAM-dependent methyltransferase [Thermodesulfobacteriota bacterium]
MAEPRRRYLPAAGHDWLLPFYDPVVRLTGGDAARRALLDQAALRPGHRVLDIGCGTGSLVVWIKQRHPEVDVVGLDPDPKALVRARRKAERAGVSVRLDRGFADALPYPAAAFDRVFSAFMLHHLEAGEKVRALGEVRRVLVADGALHLVDFGGPEARPRGLLARLFHSMHHLEDNFGGRIAALMRDAGFADVRVVARRSTLFGPVAYYRASSQGSAAG